MKMVLNFVWVFFLGVLYFFKKYYPLWIAGAICCLYAVYRLAPLYEMNKAIPDTLDIIDLMFWFTVARGWISLFDAYNMKFMAKQG